MEKHEKIKSFFKTIENQQSYCCLFYDFLMDNKYQDYWETRIFPMLNNIMAGNSFGEDWNDFIWGSVCFRQNHVMFLDQSIHKIGRKFPPILDENNEPIVDESGQWLENTEYIEQHYPECYKISLDQFIEICEKWYLQVIAPDVS